MAKAVMIPQGNGLLWKPLYVWVASLALKVLIGGCSIYPAGLCGRGVFFEIKTDEPADGRGSTVDLVDIPADRQLLRLAAHS
jgi:hypothetical protein